mmetsp:Transcript_46775/g.110328  ORF Transcript_46775/g.110328 Transcript_46775/m.110328 type:complete len:507 (-) Transcript_46775:78-1598(-)
MPAFPGLVTGALAGAVILGLLALAVGAAPAAVAGNGCHAAVGGMQHAQTLRGGGGGRDAAFVGPATWAQTAEGQRLRQEIKKRPWGPFSRSASRKRKLISDPASAVILQGFDWEAMTKKEELYPLLAGQMPRIADAGIDVVWFPPPSASADLHGYLPGKWYSVPSEDLLLKATAAAAAEGVVAMVDVVLNHRTATAISNVTHDWTAFEEPAWGDWAVVKDDWKCPPEDHLKFCTDNATCGSLDTGENACYAPDIDHHDTRVQVDTTKWLQWLMSHLGFDAFRLDNTKGYAGSFAAQYLAATKPVMAVAEFFDTNKELLTGWLNHSEHRSSLFDFGLRYKLKDSVRTGNFEHLRDEFFGPMIWYAPTNAVSFLDNHDTAGDLNDRFGTDEELMMGYAFLLTHPGVPCIFWQDWNGVLQGEIEKLIAIRREAGVSTGSTWNLLEAKEGLYAGIVKGAAYHVALKLGSADWSPNSAIIPPSLGMESTMRWERQASGPGYAVWWRDAVPA